MLEFLPDNIKNGLLHLNMRFVYELRMRADKPTMVNYNGIYRYLGLYGVTEQAKQAIYCTGEDINECVFRAGEYSVYSVEEQIKRGFITAKDGERLGLVGEYVFDKGEPLTIRNFNAVCIRIPHEIHGCGQEIYNSCMRGRIPTMLIVSSPGLGKTTILRDLARIISENTQKNILICDERGEISCGNVGKSCDVIKFSDKKTAFDCGIRAMRPDVIITDELSANDCLAVEQAVVAGVQVIASAHFSKMEHIKSPFLGLFKRFVVLDEKQIGKIRFIYDENGKEII